MASIIAAIPLGEIRPDEVMAALKRAIANPSVRDIEAEIELAWLEKAAWEAVRTAIEVEVAWAIHARRFCPECGGAGEIYIPADTGYPQPAEWMPCPRCNGWGVLDSNGRGIPPVPPRPTVAEIPF